MGDLNDRRAQKKAQTRELIRGIAQRMFGEQGFDVVTIADVAREADVAVQTVFNHFATKEELFFDGRTPWVDGGARAVRQRTPGTPPLTALREYLVDLVETRVATRGEGARRSYLATLEASDSLRAKERDLVTAGERKLGAALVEAWREDATPSMGDLQNADLETAAQLTAATWTATARVLIIDHRARVGPGVDPADVAAELGGLADRALRQLEGCLGQLEVRTANHIASGNWTDTGWPRTVAMQAG